MAYQNLGTVAWGSKPDITAVIGYDYRRSGADMQYKVKVTVNKLPFTNSTFGYPIYVDITLDSIKKVDRHTIKNASPNYWEQAYVYETDWLTVSGKSSGTTALSVNLYSGSGEDRDDTYEYSLAVAPGASVPTLSKSSMFLGETVRIQTNSADSHFFHEIWYTFGGQTGFAEDFDGISGTEGIYNWADLTPRLAVAAYLPDATSGTCTVYLRTYTDRTKTTRVGEDKSASFTLHIPQSMVPTASLTARVVNDNSVIDDWGVCVKGYSRIAYEVTADGAYGSYIQNCQFSFAGKTANALTGMMDVGSAGSFVPSARVVDSRGRSASATGQSVTVYDYNEPTIARLSVQRCDASGNFKNEGTYIRVQGAFAPGASIGGHNRVTTVCRYRQIGGNWSGNTAVADAGTVIGGSILATKTYEAEITVTDAVGGSKTVSLIIPTAEVAFHLREGGKGAAFGKYAEKNGLECAWDADFQGDVQIDGELTVGGETVEEIAVQALSNAMADYIVDSHVAGQTGEWSYKKYASGDAVLYGSFSVKPTSSTASGSLYYSNIITVSLPFGVTQASVSGTGDNLHAVVNTDYSYANKTISFRLLRPQRISTTTAASVRLMVWGVYET